LDIRKRLKRKKAGVTGSACRAMSEAFYECKFAWKEGIHYRFRGKWTETRKKRTRRGHLGAFREGAARIEKMSTLTARTEESMKHKRKFS